MAQFLCTTIFGIIFIIIGVINSKGNISTLHSYHRKRVTEEDKLPFGKKIGLGMIIIGISMILFGILSLIIYLVKNESFTLIGNIIGSIGLLVGFAIGIIIMIYAIIKYNKGIF